jgi:hypothetical protein
MFCTIERIHSQDHTVATTRGNHTAGTVMGATWHGHPHTLFPAQNTQKQPEHPEHPEHPEQHKNTESESTRSSNNLARRCIVRYCDAWASKNERTSGIAVTYMRAVHMEHQITQSIEMPRALPRSPSSASQKRVRHTQGVVCPCVMRQQ